MRSLAAVDTGGKSYDVERESDLAAALEHVTSFDASPQP